MGFKKKPDFETGRVLDLDASYQALIKPAVEAAGLECIRADEIVHSGLIDVPMYEQLLGADVVVADISTSNRNAIYELGIRHALRPFTTIIIAEEQMMRSPFFDLNHIIIRSYKHLGEDIGVIEAKRFTGELTKAITQILAKKPSPADDSPVYSYLKNLTPPSMTAKVALAAVATQSASSQDGTGQKLATDAPVHSQQMTRVDEAQKKGDWIKAKVLLEEIREARKEGSPAQGVAAEDPSILQRLALATYKSKYPTAEEALKAARDLLLLLEPNVSNDTETLGLWGAIHKRSWEVTKDPVALNEAIRGYERGYYLRNDYYNGINYAFLLNVRAANTDNLAEAIADFIQARRIRQEVIPICENWLKENADPVSTQQDASKRQADRYWVLASLAEAHTGLEDGKGDEALLEALDSAPEQWMKETSVEQVGKLKALLADSPLKNLPTGESR